MLGSRHTDPFPSVARVTSCGPRSPGSGDPRGARSNAGTSNQPAPTCGSSPGRTRREPAPRYTHGVTLRLHTYVSTDTPHTVAVRRPLFRLARLVPLLRARRASSRAVSGGDPEPRHIDTQSHLPRPPPTTAHRETRLVYGLERASTAPHQSALGAMASRRAPHLDDYTNIGSASISI